MTTRLEVFDDVHRFEVDQFVDAVLSTPEMSGHNNVIADSVKFTVPWFGKNTD